MNIPRSIRLMYFTIQLDLLLMFSCKLSRSRIGVGNNRGFKFLAIRVDSIDSPGVWNCAFRVDSHYLSRIVSCEVESLHRKSTRFRQQHGTNRREFVTEFRVLRRRFWQVSRLIRSSRIQRCRSFPKKDGPRLAFLKASQVSSCLKRSRQIATAPIAVSDCMWLLLLLFRTLQ